MIILGTKNKAPKSSTLLTIECASESQPTIKLGVEEVQMRSGENWIPDPDNRRQLVTFIDAEGEPSQILGKVGLASAVQAEGVYKVVVEVETTVKKTAARAAGGFSGQFYALNLLRVVEVWEDSKKALWKAPAVAPAGASEFDPATGKVTRAA